MMHEQFAIASFFHDMRSYIVYRLDMGAHWTAVHVSQCSKQVASQCTLLVQCSHLLPPASPLASVTKSAIKVACYHRKAFLIRSHWNVSPTFVLPKASSTSRSRERTLSWTRSAKETKYQQETERNCSIHADLLNNTMPQCWITHVYSEKKQRTKLYNKTLPHTFPACGDVS